MRRRLVVLDHALEPVDRGEIIAAAFVPAADIHLLPGQMVARQVHLEPRVAGIFRVGKTPRHFAERVHRLLRHFLIAAHVGDLDVVVERLQVPGVGDVAMAGMELDEAVGGDDRIVVLALLIERIGGHELRLGRPDRVGMLPVGLVEILHRLRVIGVLQLVHRAVVEILDRPLDILVLLRRRTTRAPARRWQERPVAAIGPWTETPKSRAL